MDCILKSLDAFELLNYPTIRRNNDKRSSTSYFWKCGSRGSTSTDSSNAATTDDDVVRDTLSALKQIGLSSSQVGFDRGCYTVQLDRTEAIPWIINEFNTHQKETTKGQGQALINVPVLSNYTQPSLNLLRCLVITSHIKQLLSKLRTQVDILPHSSHTDIDDTLTKFVYDTQSWLSPTQIDTNVTPATALLDSSESVTHTEHGLWKIKFNPALSVQGNTVDSYELKEDSLLFKQFCYLTSYILSYYRQVESRHTTLDIYHVNSSSNSYQHQILLEILGVVLPSHIIITHHVIKVNEVKLSSLGSSQSQIYIKNRKDYLITASEEKYGPVVQSSELWKDRINVLTLSCIKFEMLSRCANQVINLKDLQVIGEIKTGSFVMYNCSRLSTLFANFEQQVSQGIYPPLPSLDDVDFSLLKTEDEWTLAFHYLNVYPAFVVYLFSHLTGGASLNSLFTKVVKFLHNLSRDLSTYYSRTHILGENKPHLIPVMMARLWLLKLVYNVFCEALSLISVTPFESM